MTETISPFLTATANGFRTGEVAGSVTAAQLPDVPVSKLLQIKALSSNAGNVYIGKTGVTVADGTTDTTSGIEITPGGSWDFYVSNANLLFRICQNAGDDICYIAY